VNGFDRVIRSLTFSSSILTYSSILTVSMLHTRYLPLNRGPFGSDLVYIREE
jgi:hypothetical protein